MPQVEDKVIFTEGALNSDVDIRYIRDGSSHVDMDSGIGGRLNSHIVGDGSDGVITNIKSTLKVDRKLEWSGREWYVGGLWSLPSGWNKTIGWCRDMENDAIIFFNWNELGVHGIYRYMSNYKAVMVLVEGSELNFSRDSSVRGVVVSDYLVFTDGRNEPRMIDVKAAINYRYGSVYEGHFSYPSISEGGMRLVRGRPGGVTAIYGSDSTVERNNIRGKQFVFGVRHVYFDNSRSVMSWVSRVGIPDDEMVGGDWVGSSYINNLIYVIYDVGSDLVKEIEIYVKEGDSGVWVKYDVIRKYDEEWNPLPVSGVYSFYNDKYGVVVDQDEIVRAYDNVPQKAGYVEVVEGNQLVFGDVTLDFDPVEIDMKMRWRDSSEVLTSKTAITDIDGIHVTMPAGVMKDDLIVIKLKNGAGNWYVFTYHIEDLGGYPSNATSALYDQIRNYGSLFAPVLYLPDTIEYSAIDVSGYVYRGNSRVKTFKKGKYHPFGIQYYDGVGRRSLVNIKEDNSIDKRTHNSYVGTTTIYSPFNSEYVLSDDNKKRVIDYRIYHEAPSWAKYYGIVYAYRPEFYLKAYLNELKIDDLKYQNKIMFQVNTVVSEMRAKNIKLNLSEWQWQKGDRIRIYSTPLLSGIKTDTHSIISDYVDLEIEWEVVDGTENYYICEHFDYNSKGIGRYSLCEIYRPDKEVDTEDKYFYEIGEVGLVEADSNGYYRHMKANPLTGQDQVFDASGNCILPCEGTIEGLDYLHLRMSKFFVFPVEASSLSDYYVSDMKDRSFPNIHNPSFKNKRYDTMLIHGGRLILNTQINELNKFDLSGNAEILDERYGRITGLVYRGYELKVLQEKKNTSVYIQRNMIQGEDGQPMLVKAATVFSAVYPSREIWGTQHPESVVFYDNNIYFFDLQNGKVIRDAMNGMVAISDYGMSKFFRDMHKKSKYNIYPFYVENVTCPAFFDATYMNYGLSMNVTFNSVSVPVNYTETTTVSFCERMNVWDSFLFAVNDDVAIDRYAYNNLTTIAFVSGVPYVFHEGNGYMNLLGKQREQVVSVSTSFKLPNENKVFGSICVNTSNNKLQSDTTKNWSVKMYIPPSEENPYGGYSYLLPEMFKVREGKLYSDILRDVNSKRSGTTLYKLFNGDRMRGDVMRAVLTNKADYKVELSEVSFIGNISLPV